MRTRFLALIVAVAALAAGCTASRTDSSGADLLQFSAPLVGGGTFEGASVAGTPTVFWFWAPG